MILGTICVHGVRALPVSVKPIPKGIIGAQLQFEYADPMWDGLSKTVVFRAGDVTKDVLNAGELVNIPPEVVAEIGAILKVGVYGEGTPTLWADLGRIRDATDPSGDESTDPSLPVWEQLLRMVGDLKGLNTTAKENLVAAVNEILQKGGGTADPEEIRNIVNEYLAENPPEVDITGVVKSVNGQAPDENGNVKLEIPDSGGNVAYDEVQNLTDEQKAQARENIGAQPKGNYLTEVPDGYAKTEDIPSLDGYAKTEDVPTDAEIIQLIKDNAPESSGGGIAVTGAKVGQTVKISAVDENGVPTAWLPTDFPSGGSSNGISDGLETIADIVLEAATTTVTIDKDANNQPFELKKVVVELNSVSTYWSPAAGSTITFNDIGKSGFSVNKNSHTSDNYLYCFEEKPEDITTETYTGYLFARWELEIEKNGIALGKGRTTTIWEDADGVFYLTSGSYNSWDANIENYFTGRQIWETGIKKVGMKFNYRSLPIGTHIVIKGIRM